MSEQPGLIPINKQPTSEWDLPPTDNARKALDTAWEAAEITDQAGKAARRGDKPLARELYRQAADLTQSRWDWGDKQTWAVILLITLIGLATAATAFFLPGGQHAATPPIRVY